jgi:hypothetical protein
MVPGLLVISDELLEFLQSGVSMLTGTRDPELRPKCTRAVGCCVRPDRRGLRVYLPVATGAEAVANLRACPRIAVTFSRPIDNRTVQLKGDVIAIAEAPEEERAIPEAYREAFATEVALVGMATLVRRLACWPAWAIDVELTNLYKQTPGPDAGEPLRGGGP